MTTSEQKPTVGRIVHYGNSVLDDTEATAAIITAVEGDTVYLALFLKYAVQFERAKYSDVPKYGCWSWPKHE